MTDPGGAPHPPGAVVAVDPGEVRTGVATTDPRQVLASPVQTLTTAAAVTGVVDVALERGAVAVVVGLPLSLSGAEGTAAARARSYAERLASATPLPVFLVDERLTTVSATAALRSSGRDSRSARRVVDQVAATALLQAVVEAAVARGLDCLSLLDGGFGERVRGAR